jgi:hypothetical protein
VHNAGILALYAPFSNLNSVFERRGYQLLILTVFAWILFHGLFGRLLHVPFPEGQLFIWLKLTSLLGGI